MPEPAPPEVTALDQSEGSAMTALYRAAVGEVSTQTYAGVFAKFESSEGPGPGWNWAAALCTLNWMIFRRLWGAALAYTGAVVGGALLLFGIGRLVFQFSAEMEQALLAASVALAFILPGVFGNAIFYTACRKRIEQALAAHTTLPEACAMLQRGAGSRRRLWVVAGLNAASIAAAIAGYMATPSLDTLAVKRAPDAAATPAAAISSAVPANTASGRITTASAPAPAPAATASASASAATPASAPATTPKPAEPPASAPSAPTSRPLTQPAASAPSGTVSAPAVTASPPASATASKPTGIAAKPTTAPAKVATPAAADVTASKAVNKAGTTFAINVGLFADENNARNAYTKLIDAGLPAVQQEVRGPRGRFQRVRVGPFESRAEADAAAEKIQALGLEAIVFQP